MTREGLALSGIVGNAILQAALTAIPVDVGWNVGFVLLALLSLAVLLAGLGAVHAGTVGRADIPRYVIVAVAALVAVTAGLALYGLVGFVLLSLAFFFTASAMAGTWPSGVLRRPVLAVVAWLLTVVGLGLAWLAAGLLSFFIPGWFGSGLTWLAVGIVLSPGLVLTGRVARPAAGSRPADRRVVRRPGRSAPAPAGSRTSE